jgi:prolyl-tRNA synthetase
MLLRMSTLFLRTLREDPAEAEVPSHKLLLRAGYVRRAAPGIYSWLPLGRLVLDRVSAVVHQEMAVIGAQEVSFPALLPRDLYEQTGRWTEYGDDIFRLKDRKGGDYLLGPTHEEMFTALVRDTYSSYKDYPVILYQTQIKYRDEKRPRAGILRGREFVMKDSYSFDLDDAGLERSYHLHRVAYQKIFDRLGLRYTIVSALSGAMGGSASEEFLAETPVGEDSYVGCTNCDYAANTEAVKTPAPEPTDPNRHPPLTVLDTPDTPTIETLVNLINQQGAGGRTDWSAADTLKNVVLKVTAPGADKADILIIGVPGDREIDMKRVEAALHPSTVAMLDDFTDHPELVRGYIGPQGIPGYRYLVDPRVATGTAWITGANIRDRHAINVVAGRDFEPSGTIEAAEIRAGDACPNCGVGTLIMRRGIEVGHIFQLGRKFADALGLDALGPDGHPIRITMGSYGVGVSRLVAVVAEQYHDENGLLWPAEISPLDVHVVAAGKGEQIPAALKLGAELEKAGLRVLVDDRDNFSPGVKFKDAELLGMPKIVVVGRRIGEGFVELRDRAIGDREDVALTEIVARLTNG